MMKKLIASILCGAMIITCAHNVGFAAGVEKEGEIVGCGAEKNVDDNRENLPELPHATPEYEDATVYGRSAYTFVYVQSPLEQSWKDQYPTDYFIQANDVVEAVDNFLYAQYGIDFYSLAQPSWYTASLDATEALISARNSVGKGDADIMIAFAGPIADTTLSYTFGIAYVGAPYALVFDHDFEQNCKSAQHEVGHCYGLGHCTNTCVMKQGWENGNETDGWQLFNHICASHDVQWAAAKDKYSN